MNLSNDALQKKMKEIYSMEKYYDLSIRFNQEILSKKQLCLWYQNGIAQITAKPYVIYIDCMGSSRMVGKDKISGKQMFFFRGWNEEDQKEIQKFIHSDAELIASFKGEDSLYPNLQTKVLKWNHIVYSILRIDTKKVVKIPSNELDVIKAVEKGILILNDCIERDRKIRSIW